MAPRLAITADLVAGHLALSQMKCCRQGTGMSQSGLPLPSAHSVEGPVKAWTVGTDPHCTHSTHSWMEEKKQKEALNSAGHGIWGSGLGPAGSPENWPR